MTPEGQRRMALGVVLVVCLGALGGLYFFARGNLVYYWSPTTSGLWTIGIGASLAQSWMGTETTGGYCVGCHTVNLANPDRMAMTYGGGNGSAVAVEVANWQTPILAPETRQGNFMALSPDGTRLIRSFQGELFLDDLATNTEIGVVPTVGHATHVDWSPDGSRITYASCTDTHEDQDWVAWGCDIRMVDVLAGDEFDGEQVLIPASEDWNYYYPSFIP